MFSGVLGLGISGALTNIYQALAVGFFPASAISTALWLLLDWYPRHDTIQPQS